jgi:hypothetical protein
MANAQITPSAYGINNPLQQVFNPPIKSQRNPKTSDKYQIGQMWVNVPADDIFILTSIVANSATWTNIAGGTGVFFSVEATGGDITADVGDIVATLGDVVVAAGNITLPNTNAAGTAGEIIFGGNRWISNYGTRNTFVGQASGNTSLTVGNATYNTGIGYLSLNALTTGTRNSCVGEYTGAVISTGSNNTVIGALALATLTTGGNNVAVGDSSLNALITGSNNTCIGLAAGGDYTGAESSNICIGDRGFLGESHVMRLGIDGGGAGQQNKCYLAGTRGVAQATTDAGIMTISSDFQLGSTAAMTNGQLLIGSTGLNPVLGTLTAGAGVTITNAAGSITIAVPGTSVFWQEIVADQAAVADEGYICNKVGLLTLTLPAVAAVGDTISVTGKNTPVGWRIAQNAGQTIHVGVNATTTGVAGYVESTQLYDTIELVCITTNTDWLVSSAMGSVTVA